MGSGGGDQKFYKEIEVRISILIIPSGRERNHTVSNQQQCRSDSTCGVSPQTYWLQSCACGVC
eukprot:2681197-Amphidinium_carterae.1